MKNYIVFINQWGQKEFDIIAIQFFISKDFCFLFMFLGLGIKFLRTSGPILTRKSE